MRRVRRLFLRSRGRLGILLVFVVVFVFASGLGDHFFEQSFDEFTWSANGADIAQEVERRLSGHAPSLVPFENDWSRFLALVTPSHGSCGLPDDAVESVLLLVKSAVEHFEARQLIRRTWGTNQHLGKYSLRTVFLLGMPNAGQGIGKVVADESQAHDDILIAPFADAYTNNTYKLITALNFSNSYCEGRGTDFVLLIDDDYFVDVGNLLDVLAANSHAMPLYMGFRFDTSPFRSRFSKHRVPLSIYPFDRYPPYISAGAVLMSRHTIQRMFLASWHARLLYQLDDVYAGILAHLLHVDAIHNENFRFWPTVYDEHDYRYVVAAHGFGNPDDLKRAFNLV